MIAGGKRIQRGRAGKGERRLTGAEMKTQGRRDEKEKRTE